MTAIFMARMPDGIVAASDGALYGRDGALTAVVSKLVLMPEKNCVVTLQGPWFYHVALRAGLGEAMDFDGVLARIVDLTANAWLAADNDYGYSRAFAMLIGGFSEARQQWETYWLNSEPWEPGGLQEPYKAWELTPALATAWTPGYGREACAAAGLDPDRPLGEQGMGCAEIAVRIICAGRQQRIPIHGDEANGTCQVGGFVQIAQINRGTAWTEIAHRWPDGIGTRLDPSNGLAYPPPLV
ncbi:hypothetical protein ASF53_05265 [Methylobacterium sp. Leaf123]|uniref:hypothetical protein n=1 Tax=Methylobacterium sp. Leaf123 TaxID=1736264 RepID=UPI0006F73730|nr:hypothetical protein [Methylobacterium sp. Leaf123]KQQ23734.1 hypothetical protein ASF53_05265 [Methylobacterium sp. Leaf123]